MSDTPNQTPRAPDSTDIERNDPMIAAEYALGLLEGEELLTARGRMANDPEFAWRREWWDDWFVPLSDEIAGAEPGAHVWDAISAEVSGPVAAPETADVSNVVLLDMERKVRRWQWTAGIASAAAAVALAIVTLGPSADPIRDEAPSIAALDASPLMASIPVGDTLRLGVTFLPGSEEMLVSAAGFTADGVHDHELWLVPADGSALQSLGVVVPGEERRMALDPSVAGNMGDGVELILTREPIGGKPDGVDAGPVVAQGAFEAV